MAKPPAFQFYPADFLVGAAVFSNAEIGIYIRLLCYQWTHGHVPKDLKVAARLACCKEKELPFVLAKFKIDPDGNYFNERLETERLKQEDYRNKQAVNGAKGGRPKETQPLSDGKAKGKAKANPNTNPTRNPKKALQSSVFSLQEDKDNTDRFEEFWEHYPKKDAKKDVKAKWAKLTNEKIDLIFKALVWQLQTRKWREGYAPNPLTYLNGERWNDQPETIIIAAPPKPFDIYDLP